MYSVQCYSNENYSNAAIPSTHSTCSDVLSRIQLLKRQRTWDSAFVEFSKAFTFIQLSINVTEN